PKVNPRTVTAGRRIGVVWAQLTRVEWGLHPRASEAVGLAGGESAHAFTSAPRFAAATGPTRRVDDSRSPAAPRIVSATTAGVTGLTRVPLPPDPRTSSPCRALLPTSRPGRTSSFRFSRNRRILFDVLLNSQECA